MVPQIFDMFTKIIKGALTKREKMKNNAFYFSLKDLRYYFFYLDFLVI